jgi:hypothetical protein
MFWGRARGGHAYILTEQGYYNINYTEPLFIKNGTNIKISIESTVA